MSLEVGVVGAGIVGLSAAINVQRLIRRVRVTIIADTFGSETTTPVAPGLFLPRLLRIKGVDPVRVKEWLVDGWQHHHGNAKSQVGKISGQAFMRGLYLWSEESDEGSCIAPDLVEDFNMITDWQVYEKTPEHQYGCSFKTVAVDQTRYLLWLMKEFRERGGNVVCDTVYSLQELYGKYDVIVNCTGKRGREVKEDPFLYPVKGHVLQTVKVAEVYHAPVHSLLFGYQIRQKWPKRFLLTDDNISVIPHTNGKLVDVGFIFEPDVYTTAFEDEWIEQLKIKAGQLAPELMEGEVVSKWAERRPKRTIPLVEIEMIKCKSGPILPVVHNVGLGPDTVTLAWGTGAYAASLVQECQRLCTPFARIARPFMTLM